MDGIEYMQHSADHWVSKVQMEVISWSMKLPSIKYYCRDCGRVMDGMEYMEHSADHWVSKVQMEVIS